MLARAVSGHWQLLSLLVLVTALWQTPVVVPLKILIVFLHELSHALTVLVTGGEVVSLSVNVHQGGEVLARGGNRFLTLSAGYLGSLLLGAVCLLLAVRTDLDRMAVGGLGLLMLTVTALYVRDPFALAFCVGFGVLLLIAARWLPHDICDMALRVIGLSSMIYVPLDIYSDTIARPHLPSDAYMLAEEFGGSTMLWGGLWIALSGLVMMWALRRLGPNSNIRLPGQG